MFDVFSNDALLGQKKNEISNILKVPHNKKKPQTDWGQTHSVQWSLCQPQADAGYGRVRVDSRNLTPETRPFQKETSIGSMHFQVPSLSKDLLKTPSQQGTWRATARRQRMAIPQQVSFTERSFSYGCLRSLDLFPVEQIRPSWYSLGLGI